LNHSKNTSADILGIGEYREILELLEDFEDLDMLKEMRKKALKYRKLDDFLMDYKSGV
jgi:hypothetical protein